MSTPFPVRPKHGQLVGGLSTTPDLEASIADYQGVLGLELVETGSVSESLAAAWGCPGSSGARMATLRPRSGTPCAIRLVEQPSHPGFVPTTTFGWAAFELTVQDVFGWPDRLEESGFEIRGLPRELEGMAYFVPMQVLGRGREMVYLNEVRANMPNCDLPQAQSPVDHMFISILATPDRQGTVEWYEKHLQLQGVDTFTLSYKMINQAFDLSDSYRTELTMVQEGRTTIFEVDGYPPQATTRPTHAGMLPPGNALVSIAVRDLDALDIDWITPPGAYPGYPYENRRMATLRGPAGELLECIEHD